MKNTNFIDLSTVTVEEGNEILFNKTIEGARVYTVSAKTHGGAEFSVEVAGISSITDAALYGVYLIGNNNKVRVEKKYKSILEKKFPKK